MSRDERSPRRNSCAEQSNRNQQFQLAVGKRVEELGEEIASLSFHRNAYKAHELRLTRKVWSTRGKVQDGGHLPDFHANETFLGARRRARQIFSRRPLTTTESLISHSKFAKVERTGVAGRDKRIPNGTTATELLHIPEACH